MATVTRTFELQEDAALALDHMASLGEREPSVFLSEILLAMAGGEVRQEDFTPEQWEMIREGEAAADAGDFATPEEVEAIFNKYRSK